MTTLLDRITFNREQMAGQPCLRGLRIRVSDVLDLLAAGLSHDDIIAELPDLEPDDIRAALAFAARHFDRMRIVAA